MAWGDLEGMLPVLFVPFSSRFTLLLHVWPLISLRLTLRLPSSGYHLRMRLASLNVNTSNAELRYAFVCLDQLYVMLVVLFHWPYLSPTFPLPPLII